MSANHQARSKAWNRCSLRRTQLCQHLWSQTCSLQKWEKVKVCGFSRLSVVLCYWCPSKLIHCLPELSASGVKQRSWISFWLPSYEASLEEPAAMSLRKERTRVGLVTLFWWESAGRPSWWQELRCINRNSCKFQKPLQPHCSFIEGFAYASPILFLPLVVVDKAHWPLYTFIKFQTEFL